MVVHCWETIDGEHVFLSTGGKKKVKPVAPAIQNPVSQGFFVFRMEVNTSA
jgi:hypothetical protein